MAQLKVKPTLKYQDDFGEEFPTEAEAEASNVDKGASKAVREYVRQHFPIKIGSKRGNPHYGTAMKAIAGFLKEYNLRVDLKA